MEFSRDHLTYTTHVGAVTRRNQSFMIVVLLNVLYWVTVSHTQPATDTRLDDDGVLDPSSCRLFFSLETQLWGSPSYQLNR